MSCAYIACLASFFFPSLYHRSIQHHIHLYLCNRGSLYRIIHRPSAGETLDPRRRLRMALDVVRQKYIFDLTLF